MHSVVDEHPHRVAHAGPDAAGVAAEIDAVGTVGHEAAGLRQERGATQAGGMVDLGDDLDVRRAVIGEIAGLLAEEFVEPAEILGAPRDRHLRDLANCLERTAA